MLHAIMTALNDCSYFALILYNGFLFPVFSTGSFCHLELN